MEEPAIRPRIPKKLTSTSTIFIRLRRLGCEELAGRSVFIPYYSLSVLCVFIQLACVHRQKVMALNPSKIGLNASYHRAGHHAATIMLTGVVITALIITSFIRA